MEPPCCRRLVSFLFDRRLRAVVLQEADLPETSSDLSLDSTPTIFFLAGFKP